MPWSQSKRNEMKRLGLASSGNVKSQGRRALLRKYGLTPESYDRILDSQGGVCAFCGSSNPGRAYGRVQGSLCVDHDHATGRVRALLCVTCNCNRVGDHTLESARIPVRYLENHS